MKRKKLLALCLCAGLMGSTPAAVFAEEEAAAETEVQQEVRMRCRRIFLRC